MPDGLFSANEVLDEDQGPACVAPRPAARLAGRQVERVACGETSRIVMPARFGRPKRRVSARIEDNDRRHARARSPAVGLGRCGKASQGRGRRPLAKLARPSACDAEPVTAAPGISQKSPRQRKPQTRLILIFVRQLRDCKT
jgi:hypothetical protein